MYSKLKKIKKAQAGETMTWIVATIIIVVILTISILLTKLVLGVDNTAFFAGDKQKEAISTMSITSFLQTPQNVELLKNKDYTTFGNNVNKFLKTLPMPPAYSAGAWNFELYEGSNKVISIINYQVAGNIAGQYNYFETDAFLGTTKLRFWLVCQGTCK